MTRRIRKKNPNLCFICDMCGARKEVYRSPRNIKMLGVPRFCGRICQQKYKRRHPEEYSSHNKGIGNNSLYKEPLSIPEIELPPNSKNPCLTMCPHGFKGGYHGMACDACGYRAAYLKQQEELLSNPNYSGNRQRYSTVVSNGNICDHFKV